MGADNDTMPQLIYPAPLTQERELATISVHGTDFDVETPILIVGGGPVGMLQALMFARIHGQACMLIEREHDTTTYPKMEYTNGRSMEIYRQLGIASELRALATQHVPECSPCDELNVTSLSPGGRLISRWHRDNPEEQRKENKDHNDGSKYLEPHMRAHQILIERWLKMLIERENQITAVWGQSFIRLTEFQDGVISEVKREDGSILKIRSQYVIGCDGGGSWVRKSAGLESKRSYMSVCAAGG
jgi:2-polyprenyl-6-methoxyphenol hydroxylase-like FAD-dependent oxidoreductase